ncbi:hypothetical protein Back2_17850 [Nocardioides baekrokdamisoli]|uniref:Uncharacterized protein n=1 Tax=Nocardioides baekrokdamisoli TaxID=1804624 RepID=A0A3G9J1R8_9ACTN|nr:hypothetical protein [Nocardioides baekrokdamisoli]BBH17498.1 hypothetical protein Back2_17850 [Nocardioides baekrokdamisoli]
MALVDDITQTKVAGLLEEREPAILTSTDSDEIARFQARVLGASVYVRVLTGGDPPAGPIRDLAVEAIAVQTASEIEYAEYPEQQAPGDPGRGYHLHQRYLELLGQLTNLIKNLGGIPTDGGANGVNITPRPRGNFPPAECYPDRVIDYTRRRGPN